MNPSLPGVATPSSTRGGQFVQLYNEEVANCLIFTWISDDK